MIKLNPTRSDIRWMRALARGGVRGTVCRWCADFSNWFDATCFPLPLYDVVMEGWDETQDDCHSMGMKWWAEYHVRSRKWPFRNWLHHTLRTTLMVWKRRYVTDPYWWVRHRLDPRHRYHVLQTGLKPGYYDPDTRFLHSIFETVCAFVEDTKDTIDWTFDKEHRRFWKTLTNAVEFWRGYKDYRDHEFDSPHWDQAAKAMTSDERHAHYLALHDEEEKWETEATKHLMAIMRIRRALWYP